MSKNKLIIFFILIIFSASCINSPTETKNLESNINQGEETIVKSNTEWKKILTPEQYRVLREKGTEPAFTGKYWNTKTEGTYYCAACGTPLFSSDTKYESGCGWPSFYEAMSSKNIKTQMDSSFGMVRTEILCATCGGHLGHVFNDGPEPTGLRYCINSASLRFEEIEPDSGNAL